MMSKTLRTGIVGPGMIAHAHAEALVNLPRSEFKAVCGRDQGRAEDFARKYGIEAYTDVHEMVDREKLDAVLICTPHPVHRVPSVAAMEAGTHVLIEKPFASSLEDCDAMLEVSRRTGKQIGIIYQRRWLPPVRRIREAIDAGKIGRPVFGTINMLNYRDKEYYDSASWRGSWEGEGGGVLVNQAPHQLDLLQWFMGGEIDELYGLWSNLNHPYIEVDDTANAILKFKSGAVANIIVSNSQKPGIHGKVHVHGENGASVGVQTDAGAMVVSGMTLPPVNDLWTVPGEEQLLDQFVEKDKAFFAGLKNPQSYFHEQQIDDFLASILEGRKPAVTGADGRVTVEIFTAIYRSSRDRAPVKWPLKPEGRDDFDGRV